MLSEFKQTGKTSMSKTCLAIDIGASSGRMIAGTLQFGRITLREIARFKNQMRRTDGHCYWDIEQLFAAIIQGLRCFSQSGLRAESLGLDTWAVDYVLLDQADHLAAAVYAYRDSRTAATMAEVFQKIAPETIYAKTGIQFLQFNTIYQLYEQLKAVPQLAAAAHCFLLIPDYLNYLLCNEKAVEFTNATTTQLVNLYTSDWDDDLIGLTGLPRSVFPRIIKPGSVLGRLSAAVREQTGLSDALQVIAPATHDTGSAVAAVPALETDFAYISSGTWSLMGIESPLPLCSPAARQGNFTNEGGVFGTYRVLKNIMGLWLIQETQRLYDYRYRFDELVGRAEQAPAFRSLINPNHPCFLNPGHMIEAIRAYCRENGQPIPRTPGEVSRCIFESLAFQYRTVLLQLRAISGRKIPKIYIIGGGARNKLLNQLCANFTRCEVCAGPVEATALGNLAMQMIALGEIASLQQARAIIAGSFPVERYTPVPDSAIHQNWVRFQALP
jgi:rhamnulokinase